MVGTIHMRGLACDHTTESGADEIYVLIAGKRSDGTLHADRIPGAHDHWDMNDGDQPTNNSNGDSHIIANKALFSRELPDGQTWEVIFMIMEEDGGTTETAQTIAAKILKNVDNPYAVAGGFVLDGLTRLGVYATDTDDFIGAFAVRITNQAGKMSVEWKALDRVASELANIDGLRDNGHEFRMNGDDSNYVGWYHFYYQ
jgi:hypothetical protein